MAHLLLWLGRILIGQFVFRAMAGAGLAFVSYQGISGYIQGFLSAWAGSVSGLPSEMVALLMLAGVGQAIEIIGSAMLSVAAIRAAMMALRIGGAQ